MKLPGLHCTLNDGFAWKHAAAKRLAGEPRALAVHPDEPAVVATEIELPPLTRDAVACIAQNPGKREEYAIATFGRNVFLSRDGARSWNPIAKRGGGR